MKSNIKFYSLGLAIAIFVSACSSSFELEPTLENKQEYKLNLDNEFKSFASQSAQIMSVEHDLNKDGKISLQESGLSEKEANEIDTDQDGNISTFEIIKNLQKELSNAIKVAQAITKDYPVSGGYNGPLPEKLPSFTSKPNKVELFIDKDEILPMMFDTIRNAKKSIQMDVFLLGGNIGLQIAQELVKKKNEGVNIELMMDPNLGFGGPTQQEIYNVLSFLQKNDITFRLYPLHLMPKVQNGLLKNKFQIDHNKLYVIDEEILIIGGFNLFDIGVINRDLMLKIEGPTAKDASKMMRYEWSLGDKFVYKLPRDVYVIKNENPFDSLAKIVRTDPFESTTKSEIINAIDNATQSVYLGVLEFSDIDITRALIRAHRRGVDVRVLMDRKNTNDKYAGGVPVPSYFPNILPATELFKNRVPVKWYDPRVRGQELHLKMVLVDGNKLITGSTNFTRQAFTTFRETSVVIEGGSAPAKMRRIFMEDWLNSSTSLKKITLKDKIKAKVVDFMDRKYYAWW